MPKSRNRGGHKGATRQVLKKSRGIQASLGRIMTALQYFNEVVGQHAGVINAQRDKIAKQDLHIQLLEERVYAGLTAEERERLADILDPQPEAVDAVAEPDNTPSDPTRLHEALADAGRKMGTAVENLEPEASAADASDEPGAELINPAA